MCFFLFVFFCIFSHNKSEAYEMGSKMSKFGKYGIKKRCTGLWMLMPCRYRIKNHMVLLVYMINTPCHQLTITMMAVNKFLSFFFFALVIKIIKNFRKFFLYILGLVPLIQ